MRLTLVLIIGVFVSSCKGGQGGNVSVACNALTGKYEMTGGGVQEMVQDSCGPKVNIENKVIGINGQTLSQSFLLDGVRKREAGSDPLNYRFYTRTWENDTWIDQWELYESGQLKSVTVALFYLDQQGNLVFEYRNEPGSRKVYKRLK